MELKQTDHLHHRQVRPSDGEFHLRVCSGTFLLIERKHVLPPAAYAHVAAVVRGQGDQGVDVPR